VSIAWLDTSPTHIATLDLGDNYLAVLLCRNMERKREDFDNVPMVHCQWDVVEGISQDDLNSLILSGSKKYDDYIVAGMNPESKACIRLFFYLRKAFIEAISLYGFQAIQMVAPKDKPAIDSMYDRLFRHTIKDQCEKIVRDDQILSQYVLYEVKLKPELS
jgi:hypothetical protein